MEEGQRHLYKDGAKTVTGVLILVVMEEGQRHGVPSTFTPEDLES